MLTETDWESEAWQKKYPMVRDLFNGNDNRNYLVGKALFVYWPSGYRPTEGFPLGIIPNLGGMKLIYGGSSTQP